MLLLLCYTQSCPTLCGPRTAARQAPLSMGPPGKNTGVAASSRSRDPPDPGTEEPKSSALQADSLPLSHLGLQAVLYKYCL